MKLSFHTVVEILGGWSGGVISPYCATFLTIFLVVFPFFLRFLPVLKIENRTRTLILSGMPLFYLSIYLWGFLFSDTKGWSKSTPWQIWGSPVFLLLFLIYGIWCIYFCKEYRLISAVLFFINLVVSVWCVVFVSLVISHLS